MPRRKPGALLPLELQILDAALSLQRSGARWFHGFGLAQSMGDADGRRLIGHGTLYKALARLEEMGLVSSRWEQDPPEGRPRRRLYELTSAGTAAVLAAPASSTTPVHGRLASGPA